jgi:hypothetical protein
MARKSFGSNNNFGAGDDNNGRGGKTGGAGKGRFFKSRGMRVFGNVSTKKGGDDFMEPNDGDDDFESGPTKRKKKGEEEEELDGWAGYDEAIDAGRGEFADAGDDTDPPYVEGASRGLNPGDDSEDEEVDKNFGPENGNPYFLPGSVPDYNDMPEPEDEADKLSMNDMEYFKDALKKHVYDPEGIIDVSEMDPLDELMATAFTGAMKTPDGSFMHVQDTAKRNKAKLPKARTMVQLYKYCQPPVLQNSAPDDAGVALAAEAWGVSFEILFLSENLQDTYFNSFAHLILFSFVM